MARYHRRMRDRVDARIGAEGPAIAVVLLTAPTGVGGVGGLGGTRTAHDPVTEYVENARLDPGQWIERDIGGFGLVVALSVGNLYVFRTTKSMRRGDIELVVAAPRARTALCHKASSSVPGLHNRLLHFTLPDGRFVVGLAPEARLATNDMNDVAGYLDAWGPTADDLDQR